MLAFLLHRNETKNHLLPQYNKFLGVNCSSTEIKGSTINVHDFLDNIKSNAITVMVIDIVLM